MGQEFMPVVDRLLGTEHRALLRPPGHAHAVARSFEGAGFDPAHPGDHANYAYVRAADWPDVQRSVLGERDHASHPVLHCRLAGAARRSGDRRAAASHWFSRCWLAPDMFENLVESPSFPDRRLKANWERAWERSIRTEMSGEWFPAWAILQDAALAQSQQLRPDEQYAVRASNIVVALRTGA